MVEDVVTTGLSSREAIAAVGREGGEVVAEVALVDRSNGAADLGVPFFPLVDITFPTYADDEVPEDLAIEWMPDGTYVSHGPIIDFEDRRVDNVVKAVLQGGKAMSTTELHEATGESEANVKRAVYRMTSVAGDLELTRDGRGIRYDPYVYRLTSEGGASDEA